MAIVHGRLTDIQTIPSTVGPIFTNPASQKSYIKGMEFYNANTTAETVRIYNVPTTGGSIGTAEEINQILEIVLAAKEKFIYESPGDGRCLASTNDTIQAVTTTMNKVVVEFFAAWEAV